MEEPAVEELQRQKPQLWIDFALDIHGAARELSIRDDHDQEILVPPEIRARGPKALEAFQKALKEGKTRVRRVPVMFVGQERAGKTSLKKSLTGKKFDPDEKTTIGVDFDSSPLKVTTDAWKAEATGSSGQDAANPVSFEFEAAKLVVENLELQEKNTELPKEERPTFEEERKKSSSNEASKKQDPKAEKRDEQNLGAQFSPDEEAKMVGTMLQNEEAGEEEQEVGGEYQDVGGKDQGVGEEPETRQVDNEMPDDVAKLIETLLQNKEAGEEDEDAVYCTLSDFAGQFVFYATHSVFLTRRAIYLLVNDLSKDPHQEPDPLVRQGRSGQLKDSNLARTNMDFLHFWMNSVASLAEGQKGSPSRPPVIFVCTHADKPYEDERPQDLARKIYCGLKSKPYKSHLVDKFFVVDNTRSGSEAADPEVAEIRKKIQETAKDLQDPNERIPVKWLRFEKSIVKSVEEGFNHLTRSEVEKIARDVCEITDEGDVRAVLDFFHDLGVLVHFDDTPRLDDLVIINPQWLINVFKEVITIPLVEKQESSYSVQWERLEDTGILERELLERVWRHLVNDQDTVEALVGIMEKFSLLCRWPCSATEELYLVPQMLMSYAHPKELEKLKANSSTPSLFIRLSSGSKLQILFPNLLVNLIREWPKCWSSQSQPKLYRNLAIFYLNLPGSWLMLQCHSEVIEVFLNPPTSSLGADMARVCSRIHGLLLATLERVRKDCCWLRVHAFDFYVRCTVCCEKGTQKARCTAHGTTDCPEVECLHFFSLTELREHDKSKKPISCEKGFLVMDNTVQVQKFFCWLHKTSDEADGDPVKGGSPSEIELLELSRKITSFWLNLGMQLGLSYETLENIDLNNVRFGSPQRKGLQMLREWSQRRETFSYQALSQALIKEGKAELAQKYCAYQSTLR